ncbi:MAG: hypothetical protein MJ089_04090 [Ruminococcus sp.]|nr:hypothetical protein [Ruminococcus sp.]
MENMIEKIVDADNEAKAMEEATLKEKEKLSKEIELEAQLIYDKYMSDAEKIVARNNENEEKRAEQKWKEINNKQNSVHIKLQSDYEQNCDKWVEEIVKRTLAQ